MAVGGLSSCLPSIAAVIRAALSDPSLHESLVAPAFILSLDDRRRINLAILLGRRWWGGGCTAREMGAGASHLLS